MSQNVFSKLHDFADFLKKSLILNIINVIFAFFSFITLLETRNYAANYFFTVVMILLEIVLLIFQALMLQRLSQAKELDNSKELLNAFQYKLGAIIVGIILVFVGNGFFGMVLIATQFILNLNGWKSLTAYLNIRITRIGPKDILRDLKDGMQTYTNSIYSSIAVLFFIWLAQLGNAPGFLIILGMIDVAVSCFIIYALFRLANAMLTIEFEDFGEKTLKKTPITPRYRTFKQPVAEDIFDTPAYDNNDPNQDKFCPMCGSLNEKKAIFCIACGSKF